MPPLTGGPHLSAPVSRARPLSPARCRVDLTCRRQLLHPLALSLSLSLCFAGPVCERRAVVPTRPLFSICVVDPPCQICLPRAHRGLASAHSRKSPGFSATMPAHVPNSFFRALPVPRTRPSPHFAHPRPLSCSALAARRRRRPEPVFSTIQLTGYRPKPPRAPPRGETLVPVPNFPYCVMCSSNFAFASV
jgi:hypothetical protein